MTEWWGALVFVLCFCALAAMWWRSGLRLRLQTDPGGPWNDVSGACGCRTRYRAVAALPPVRALALTYLPQNQPLVRETPRQSGRRREAGRPVVLRSQQR